MEDTLDASGVGLDVTQQRREESFGFVPPPPLARFITTQEEHLQAIKTTRVGDLNPR